MRILADTNIILRRIQRAHPQHIQTRDAITRITERGDQLCVFSQNLIECWTVCTRPRESNGLGLLPDKTAKILSRVERSVLRLADDADEVYREWFSLVIRHGVSGKNSHDARLVAAMKVHAILHVLTFNTADFARFEGVSVINPAELSQP